MIELPRVRNHCLPAQSDTAKLESSEGQELLLGEAGLLGSWAPGLLGVEL